MRVQTKAIVSLVWTLLFVVAIDPAIAAKQPDATKDQTQKTKVTPTDTIEDGATVNIDFKDADIRLVIRSIAELTGKNFIIDDKVKGKVTIISPRNVTPDEAYKVFESTMEVYGFSLVESGTVIKVIPITEARQKASFAAGPKQPSDKIVTRLIPLENVKAQDMVTALRPLIPPTSYITAYQNTNTIIITDYEANIAKIMGIIEKLDSPMNQDTITVIQLSYAGAKELAAKLEKIFKEGSVARSTSTRSGRQNKASSSKKGSRGRGAPPPVGAPPGAINPGRIGTRSAPKIIPDERINALIVVAPPSFTQQILTLVSQLDIPPPPGRGGINVYYLKHADAEELSKVLGNITQQAAGQKRGAPPIQPGKGLKLSGDVTITPDKATNSLVITASVEDFETLKAVIAMLDIRRRQVFVEALIVEVSTSRSSDFGIEWRTTSDFTQSGLAPFGGVNYGTINQVAQDPFAVPVGMTIGVIDGIISFGGQDFLNIGALLHVLRTDSNINILATPNIMTTDNVEAEIIVAQEVPFVTGQSQNTGGTTLTTIERKNIGLTLKITPQISESDELKLEVYQEISNISPIQLDKAQDLITSTRSIRTTVVVKNHQMVVLGGLISDDVKDVVSKVPGLGDIPLLGWLFKSTQKEKAKTNLLVFLTPHIINNDEDIESIRERRKKSFESNPEFSKRLKAMEKMTDFYDEDEDEEEEQ